LIVDRHMVDVLSFVWGDYDILGTAAAGHR
jgi:hypothetical protein